MGAGRPRGSAELLVEFAEVDCDDAIGTRVYVQCEFCSVPERKNIPKLRDLREDSFGLRTDGLKLHNANYYRELAEYEFVTRMCREVRITVKNIGETAANNVRVELVVAARCGLLPTEALPEKPVKDDVLSARIPHGIRSVHRRNPGEVDIDQNEDRYRIEIDCKDLQPGRQVWSDRFYIGVRLSGDCHLRGHVFADNLPFPLQFTFTVTADVKQTTLRLEELCAD